MGRVSRRLLVIIEFCLLVLLARKSQAAAGSDELPYSGHRNFRTSVLLLGLLLSLAISVRAQAQATASFVELDSNTEGTWHGVYGFNGYSVVNNSQSIPPFASFAVQNQSNFTWAASTTDSRALQTGTGSGRIASCWFSSSTFDFDVNFTDGNSHQFALYALDWDRGGRSETIQILDASTQAVLDTRAISTFTNGLYLVWNISGHVTINVTRNAGPNAVVSGVFWDPVGGFPVIPVISSLSPNAAAIGAPVTVTGTNFGSTQGSSSITFNNVAAVPTSWSATTIDVSVPTGATSGNVVVTVSGVAGNGATFTVIPNISNLSPIAGGANTFVTISGSGFGPTMGTSTVTFNGVTSRPTSWSPSTILVPVPGNATTGPVLVTVSGTASNEVSFTFASTGTISGTVARASDGSAVSGAVVQALQSGSVIGSATTAADGTYTISALTAGTYDVSASSAGFLPTTNPSNLVSAASTTTVNVVLGAPNIASLSPASGPIGSSIGISGSNFGNTQGQSTVTFNGIPAISTRWSSTNIVVPVPTGASTGPVVVTVAAVPSNSVNFTVGTGTIAGTVTKASDGTPISGALVEAMQSNATITSINTAGDGTYTLSNVAPGTYDVRFSASGFGTALQTGKSVSAGGSATVNAALSLPGTLSGTVTKSDGVTGIASATVTALQGTDTASSATTDSSGNYSISNLSSGNYSVQAAAVGYNTQTQAGVAISTGNTTTENFTMAGQSVISYSYDALGRLTGTADSQGDAVAYSYDAVGNLVSISRNSSSQTSIGAFTPASGPIGTSVTITGTAFSTTLSQNSVSFNGTSATVTSATATQLVVTVPNGATTGAISVTAPSGSATSSASFNVTASNGAPTISGFSPNIGLAGTAVAIAGANFDIQINDRVGFNLTGAPTTSATSTSISTTVPTSTASGHISVATAVGRAVSANDFYVVPPGYTAAQVTYTGRILIGGSTTVSTSTPGATGLVLFDGSAGQRVSVLVTNVTNPAAGVALLNPDGTQHAGITISPGLCSPWCFLDTQTLSTTGTYTVWVVPSASYVGSETLQVQNVPADITGPITAGGSPVTVAPVTGQDARLTFSGTSGQRISVLVTNVTNPSASVELLNPNGTAQAGITISPGLCSSWCFLDTQTLSTTGIYTVWVKHNVAYTGSETLQLQNVPPDITEPITAGGSPVTVAPVTGQDARLTFSGTSGQRVSVLVTNVTNPSASVELLNPDGTAQAGITISPGLCSSWCFLDTQTLATTGTYTVWVKHNVAYTGSETLQLNSQ